MFRQPVIQKLALEHAIANDHIQKALQQAIMQHLGMRIILPFSYTSGGSELVAPVILAAIRAEVTCDLGAGYHQLGHSFDASPMNAIAATSVLVTANNFAVHMESDIIATALRSALLVKHDFYACGPGKADVYVVVLAVVVRML